MIKHLYKLISILIIALLFQLDKCYCQKKVTISEFVFDSPIDTIKWIGSKGDFVLVKTKDGLVYRSSNGGKAWMNIIPLIQKALNVTDPSSPILVNKVIVQSKLDNIILVTNTKQYVTSIDKGETFQHMKLNGQLGLFLFHSTKSSWGIFSLRNSGCETHVNSEYNDKCVVSLFFTANLGQNMSLITDHVVQFSWGDKASRQEDYIYYSKIDAQLGSSISQSHYIGWSESVNFYAKTTPFSREKLVVRKGNRFQISNEYIFVAMPQNIIRQTVNLIVSSDGGATFNEIRLPEQLQQHSYSILDTSENAVIIYVNHGHHNHSGHPHGHIYISDSKGISYSMSLANNVRSSFGECEFDKVASLDGVYLANIYQFEDAKDDELYSNEEVDSIQTEVEKRDKSAYKKTRKDIIKTVVSFNKGGSWSYLKPPLVDSQGKQIKCDSHSNITDEKGLPHISKSSSVNPSASVLDIENCSLNLNGATNFYRYPPFYSVQSAVGLIIGTGHVGKSLNSFNDVNTYLSRDGGSTWIELCKGSFIYEIGDHGGLIVMTENRRSTSRVIFSWTEGETWYDFRLGDSLINVENIIIEPNSSAVEFLLYGTRLKSSPKSEFDRYVPDSEKEGIIYHLDFSTILPPECSGAQYPDSVSSDYQTWIPGDNKSEKGCLLGRRIVYTRRKPTAKCFNGSNFTRGVFKNNCLCTESDYECEFGFKRNINSYKCEPIDKNYSTHGCTSSGAFLTTAYRKIPGDTCVQGWTPPAIKILCPHTSPFTFRAKLFLCLIIMIAIILFIRTYYGIKYPLSVVGQYIDPNAVSSVYYSAINQANRYVDSFWSKTPNSDNFNNHNNERIIDGVELTKDTLGFADTDEILEPIEPAALLDFSNVKKSNTSLTSMKVTNFPPPPDYSTYLR